MPLQATSGAASYDAFGGGVVAEPNYIESVFSTWLYAGTGANQTITNGIDEAGKGAMTWIKCRTDATSHALYDTERGAGRFLTPNATSAQSTSGSGRGLSSFNSTGFSLDDDSFSGRTNQSGQNYASWTFRKQPKFFDVVTYTGNGTSGRTVAHNLGSVPGCIIVKCLNDTTDWPVYHRSLNGGVDPQQYRLRLNSTAAEYGPGAEWSAGAPTATEFTLTNAGDVNASGRPYVAYLFAHNAGGFGLTGTDNVISCGLTTANGSGDFSVNLGYEPQWILIKSTGSGLWSMIDNMRGATASSGYTSSKRLQAHSSAAEDQLDNPYGIGFNATGFTGNLATFSNDFIYIAIRRGPMKVPTTGTSVFSPVARTGTGSATTLTSAGFPPDLYISQERTLSSYFGANWFDRLRGSTKDIWSAYTDAETNAANTVTGFDAMQGVILGTDGANFGVNASGVTYANWNFRRAPGFFDEVCYTGTGAVRTVAHNLAAVPELMIVKRRDSAGGWIVYYSGWQDGRRLILQGNNALISAEASIWNNTAPTSTNFTVGTSLSSPSGSTYVNYLFATCPGVSKVFSFTGNGSSQTINCGFTAGSRFVLIKRTDSTGDWYVWDSARGIVSGNDPHLSLNTTAAEVTTDDSVDTDSTGFIVNQNSATNVNVNGATYIGLAVA